jgi:DNA repair exonuclease SbcCD ATPase subunit
VNEKLDTGFLRTRVPMEGRTEAASRLSAERVGGISSTEVTLREGVTVLTGRNATNRTSFLRAVMAAMGGDDVSLKGDADEGSVELEVDGERYTRTLARRDGETVLGGDPYLEDPVPGDLFAFLTEDNEARRAVARGEDLREVIMRPVDTAAIRAGIERLEAERREVEAELERLDGLEAELSGLESEREELRAELRERREALEAERAALEGADATVAESREQREDLDAALEELRDARSELESTERRLGTQRESREALEADLAEAREALEALPEPAVGLEGLEREIERLREHRRTVESTVSRLQRILEFNEELLEGSGPDPGDVLPDPGDGNGDVTDGLLGDRVVCWTCGSEVDRDAVEATLEDLREVRRERAERREEIEAELAERKDRRDRIRRQQDRREDLAERVERIERELEEREGTVAELESRREELAGEVDRLEERVAALESERHESLLELHREVNRLEFEVDRLRGEVEECDGEIERLERELEAADRLAERREELGEQLTERRTRIERLESRAVEAFNDHMDRILDVLEYGNVERIWIERVEREVREGRRTVERSAFEMHVVRRSESGAAYEDTVEHLSESEREVTGLVFALAGYLVHEVHESVPFVLLDSLEALDADRIAALVDYFAEYPDYLLVALLPEDAAALEDDYRRVTDI